MERYFAGNRDAFFLDESADRFAEPLILLGVSKTVRVRYREPNWQGHIILSDERGDHSRGMNGFDPEFWIDGLGYALANIDIWKASYIWNEILIPRAHTLWGQVQHSTRSDFADPETIEECSIAGMVLRDNAWLPDKQGRFHKPEELSLDELHDDCVHSEKLADQLGMRHSSIQQLAEELQLDMSLLRFVREHLTEFESLAEEIRERELHRREDVRPGVPGEPEPPIGIELPPEELPPEEIEPSEAGTEQRRRSARETAEAGRAGGAVESREEARPKSATRKDGETEPVPMGGRAGAVSTPREWTSYPVGVFPGEPPIDVAAERDKVEARGDTEQAGVGYVANVEEDQGRTATIMPPQNTGYDIQSRDSVTGELRYIEVKAVTGGWEHVTLTKAEFDMSRDAGDEYWLYVVEDAGSDHPSVYQIQNPAGRANMYVFTKQWRNVAQVQE